MAFAPIRPGMKIKGIGKQGLPTRRQSEVFASCSQALMNTQIVRGTSDEFRITPNNMTLQLKDNATASSASGAMHPFKVYPTGTFSGSNVGYNVRTGLVDVRYLFHSNDSTAFNGPGTYASRVTPANVDSATIPPSYTPITIPLTNTFYLDPTPETIYGAYYSFWIEITPDTDNGGAYNGTVQVKSQRFSRGTVPTDPFPGIGASGTFITAKEYIPLAIVQVTAAVTPLLAVPGLSSDGLIYQIATDNFTQRYPYNPYYGAMSFWGEWGVDAGVSSGNRFWYPGDWIFFSGAADFYGHYVWADSPGQLGGTPSGPLDGSSQFKKMRNGSAPP